MLLTVILAYYMNPGMLVKQYATFAALPATLRKSLKLIIVDDGSPSTPAFHREIGMPVEVYRVLVDVRWNQDACRNIGVHHATTEWVLMTDMDHLLPEQTLARVMGRQWQSETVYRFSRVTMESKGHGPPVYTQYKPHPNSWLMTRLMFNRIGGYDERFAGWYGTDADFRRQVERLANIVTLKEVLIRVPRDVIPDASTTTYLRKQDADYENIKRIRKQIAKSHDLRPKTLSFPYSRVA